MHTVNTASRSTPRTTLIVTAVFALAGCSGAAAAQPLPAADAAHIREICHTVMGLNPNEVHFDGCVDSLSHTLLTMQEAQRLQSQREACGSKGLHPGTRDFAVCVVSGS